MIVLGLLALSSTLCSTLTNRVIAQDYPDYWENRKTDNLFSIENVDTTEVELLRAALTQRGLVRLARLQEIASLFYVQALFLWGLLVIALCLKVGIDFWRSF